MYKEINQAKPTIWLQNSTTVLEKEIRNQKKQNHKAQLKAQGERRENQEYDFNKYFTQSNLRL